MDIRELKIYIFDNNHVEDVLSGIQCHHIKYHASSGYWTCANANGDNTKAITLYNNEHLTCLNHTRSMVKSNKTPDLIDLVSYTLDLSFPEALKSICGIIGLSYYHDFEQDEPESFRILKELERLSDGDNQDKEIPLLPIPEKVLTYYHPYVNDLFNDDGISYRTQIEFEVGYDDYSNRITIPIRSEIGDLVGVKGRLFKKTIEKWEDKYLYIEPCAKSRVLYGLHKTLPFIKKNNCVYIGESEKFVMQLWEYGYKNAVSTGGSKISPQQIEMLVRAGGIPIFCYDKDIKKNDYEDIAYMFPDQCEVYYIYDEDGILKEKESPSDSRETWEYMIENNVYKIK